MKNWIVFLMGFWVAQVWINSENVKKFHTLTTQESLDRAEIKELQNHQDVCAKMNFTPENIQAIKDLSQKIEVQNEYLHDFIKDKNETHPK